MKDKTDYGERLKEDYKKWDTIWKTGWSDPNYPDGEGLHGFRNQIISDKRELEKEGGEMPEEVAELAKKARFSQHTLTEEEREQAVSAARASAGRVDRALPWYKRLWCRYVLGLL